MFRKIVALSLMALCVLCVSCNMLFQMSARGGDFNTMTVEGRYTVTFILNGGTGTAPSAVTVNAGAVIQLPDSTGFSFNGFDFDGWNTEADGSGTGYDAGDDFEVTANTLLYAKWEWDNHTQFTVTYNSNGGTGTVSSQTVNAGVVIQLSNSTGLSYIGHHFNGWNTVANGSGTGYDAGDNFKVTAAAILYAQWEIDTYTVTFNANGGTPAPPQQTVEHGGKVDEPAAMTRDGYTFSGWFKELAFTNQWNFETGTVTDTDTDVNGILTLYAKWEVEPEPDPDPDPEP